MGKMDGYFCIFEMCYDLTVMLILIYIFNTFHFVFIL